MTPPQAKKKKNSHSEDLGGFGGFSFINDHEPTASKPYVVPKPRVSSTAPRTGPRAGPTPMGSHPVIQPGQISRQRTGSTPAPHVDKTMPLLRRPVEQPREGRIHYVTHTATGTAHKGMDDYRPGADFAFLNEPPKIPKPRIKSQPGPTSDNSMPRVIKRTGSTRKSNEWAAHLSIQRGPRKGWLMEHALTGETYRLVKTRK